MDLGPFHPARLHRLSARFASSLTSLRLPKWQRIEMARPQYHIRLVPLDRPRTLQLRCMQPSKSARSISRERQRDLHGLLRHRHCAHGNQAPSCRQPSSDPKSTEGLWFHARSKVGLLAASLASIAVGFGRCGAQWHCTGAIAFSIPAQTAWIAPGLRQPGSAPIQPLSRGQLPLASKPEAPKLSEGEVAVPERPNRKANGANAAGEVRDVVDEACVLASCTGI